MRYFSSIAIHHYVCSIPYSFLYLIICTYIFSSSFSSCILLHIKTVLYCNSFFLMCNVNYCGGELQCRT